MATVYRGITSRIIGVVYGVVWLAVAGGGYWFVRENVFAGVIGPTRPVEWIPVGLVAFAALWRVVNVGRASVQRDYRVIVNYHRRELNVQFGHKLLG